jgi:hypothetical protein
MEERHHATMNVVVEVAVEQPGAGIVCVSIKRYHSTGHNSHLTAQQASTTTPSVNNATENIVACSATLSSGKCKCRRVLAGSI